MLPLPPTTGNNMSCTFRCTSIALPRLLLLLLLLLLRCHLIRPVAVMTAAMPT
jgi:hypothetical protein